MKVRCTASALRIRSLPMVNANTDTGRRMIRGQIANTHGVSFNEAWWYVDAPAGRGWCSKEYLQVIDRIFTPDPAWPSVPNGRRAIDDLFGRPGSVLATAGRVVLPDPLKIGWLDQNANQFSCHKLVEDIFQSAFDQIFERDLWEHLETYDGCYNDRTITSSQKVSTHAWGISVDLNAATNRLGQKPTMDKTIVAIFKDHGFTWGGDWNRPDGMHFQYARGY